LAAAKPHFADARMRFAKLARWKMSACRHS
jgi:hypothetical protein